MSSIAGWLDQLGLVRYAEAFAENGVDFDILPDITNDDLKDLGISRLADRKRILKAIGELQAEADGAEPASAAEDRAPPAHAVEAERRQLTVMFVDLVGSTALSSQLDPEELRELIRAYQEACAGVVARFDGHIAKYIGDGIMVYFGYPQAHEDDARRAVSAGLGIVERIEALNQRLAEDLELELGVRIGIHTGLVVAGEMGGGDTREAQAVVGETPNVAARLQELAPANGVVISAATQSLAGGLFELDDLGARELRGVARPLRLYRVRGESDTPSRFEASTQAGLSPLVGRAEEIALLAKRWQQATEGDGQAVLLVADAGIGKSRLARAFRDHVKGQPHRLIVYYCSPYHENSALHPVIGHLERAFEFRDGDDPECRREKLEAALSALGLVVDGYAPLLASLLSLPVKGDDPSIGVSSQLLRQKTLEAVLAVIEASAANEPVALIVEDAHWIDPSTQEMLNLLIERLATKPIFMLANCRPGMELPWGAHAHVTALRLNRLSRKESAAIVSKIAGGKELPEVVLEQIVAKADGVPLFVEELTKTVLESGLLSEASSAFELTGDLTALAVPASLHDSLMARLDRLSSAKEVAQLAAALGRSFSYQLLSAVCDRTAEELDDALAELEGAGLVFRRGVSPDSVFEFKHALVQDAAYQALLKSTRQRHHARIAQVLTEAFPGTAEAAPELLAHHYTEAGQWELAIEGWLEAARRAMRRSANVEAERHLKRGLAVREEMPDGPQRRRLEIKLYNTLGVALTPIRGFSDPEVDDAFSRAAAISEREGDADGLFVALRGKGQYQMISGDLPTAREQAARILELAEASGDPGYLIEAHHLGWSSMTFTGDFAAARRHADAGIALYQRERDHSLAYVYSGHDPGVCSRSFGALAMWQHGFPDQGRRQCLDGLALAEDLAHPFSITVALWAMGVFHLIERDIQALPEIGQTLIDHCREKGFAPFVPLGMVFRGGARAEDGLLDEGIAELREGIIGLRAIGTQYTLPTFLAWQAELHGRAGHLEEALQVLTEAETVSVRGEVNFTLPEIHRLKGDFLLARSAENRAAAEACYREGAEVARRNEGRSLDLRATMRLARLWGESGRRAEARELLAPIYGQFTEGFDTPDLTEAKALLDDLA